jgi:aminoglycoside phosphotransferase (APT) family kinase protein
MHADEVELDDATVRGLLSAQFPRWADLPLRRLPDSGTDNAIYQLGDDMGVRLPRIHWAVPQIDKECRWLGHLAARLPVAVPVPIGRGEPGGGYPFPWLVYPWLGGTSLDRAAADTTSLAGDVASFVLALQEIPPDGGPQPGRRGGPMAPLDRDVEWAIEKLDGVIDTRRVREVWRAALEAEPTERKLWIHGDLLPGNILVREGRLVGIIDWSATGVGDPACDAMFAWALGVEDRALYRRLLGFDDATWARARGWVVERTVLYIPYYADTLPGAVAQARRRLEAALSDEP